MEWVAVNGESLNLCGELVLPEVSHICGGFSSQPRQELHLDFSARHPMLSDSKVQPKDAPCILAPKLKDSPCTRRGRDHGLN